MTKSLRWCTSQTNQSDGPYLKHEAILNIEQNFSTISVIFDKNVKRISVLDPAKQPRIWRKWDDWIAMYVQVPLEAVRIHLQESIH